LETFHGQIIQKYFPRERNFFRRIYVKETEADNRLQKQLN